MSRVLISVGGVKTSSWSDAWLTCTWQIHIEHRFICLFALITRVCCRYPITATRGGAADLMARLKFQPEVCVTWPMSRDATERTQLTGSDTDTMWWWWWWWWCCCCCPVPTHDTPHSTVSGPHDSYNLNLTLYGTVGNMHIGGWLLHGGGAW